MCPNLFKAVFFEKELGMLRYFQRQSLSHGKKTGAEHKINIKNYLKTNGKQIVSIRSDLGTYMFPENETCANLDNLP